MKLKVAGVPLNFTLLTPVKFAPLIVTAVPGDPLDGEKLLIVGFADTMKSVALIPVMPPELVTAILPVVAPAGTVAVRLLSVVTLYVVATLLNFTADTSAAPPEKYPLPVTVTSVPGGPLSGLNVLIVGVAA